MGGKVTVELTHIVHLRSNCPAEAAAAEMLVTAVATRHEREMRQELADLFSGREPYRDFSVTMEA